MRSSATCLLSIEYCSLILSYCILSHNHTSVCIEDTQNIYGTEEGVLLDNPNIVTLQHPEEHSFHCLLDVSSCYKSGFRVLGEKDPTTDRHRLGYRLDDSEAVLTVGRASGKKGYCSTCDGGTQETGFRATVRGIIKDIGDGSDPTLTSFTMLDASVGCDGDDNPAVLSSGTDNESNGGSYGFENAFKCAVVLIASILFVLGL